MKKLLHTLLISMMLVFAVGCSSAVDSGIKNLDALVADVEENGDVYSDDEWVEAMEKYVALCGEIRNAGDKLSDEQRAQLVGIKGRMTDAILNLNIDALSIYAENHPDSIEDLLNELTVEPLDDDDSQLGGDELDFDEMYDEGLDLTGEWF